MNNMIKRTRSYKNFNTKKNDNFNSGIKLNKINKYKRKLIDFFVKCFDLIKHFGKAVLVRMKSSGKVVGKRDNLDSLLQILKRKPIVVFSGVLIIICLFIVFRVNKKDSSLESDGQGVIDFSGSQKDENGNEISFENLGDFWIEIDTDDLKIKAPVVEGVSQEKLDQGVGHHRKTAFPSREKGNVVLSGHRWSPGNNLARTVFIDLDKLKVGDKIKLHYKDQEFSYKITETKTVFKKETSILDQTEKPQVTIYTCTPKYTSLKRLVYIGELVE